MKFAIILAAVALATAVRATRPIDNLFNVIIADQTQADVLHELLVHKKESEDAYAVIKYKVQPSQAEELIQKVVDAKKAAEQQEGFKAFHLSRALDSNECLALWLHWESAPGLLAFMHSDAAQDLTDHITKNDIVAHIHPTKVVV